MKTHQQHLMRLAAMAVMIPRRNAAAVPSTYATMP